MEKKMKINGLTLLRVVAVLMIVMVHFCQSWSLPSILHQFVHFGMYGVQIFFLLSGYLIFASLNRNGYLKTFYKRRAVRIIPIYYAVVVINFLLFDVVFKVIPADATGLGWFRYIFFLNTLIPSDSVDYWNNLSALWSIPAFILFYAVAPLLFKTIKNIKAAWAETVIVLCLNIASLNILEKVARGGTEYTESIQYIAGKNPLSVLWIFFVGGCVWKAKENKAFLSVPFTIGIIGLIYGISTYTLVAIFALLIYFLSDYKPDLGKVVSWIVGIIDEYSFSIYLGHTKVLNVVSYLRDSYGLSTLYVIGMSGIGTVIMVLVLHNLIEKPAAKRLLK